MGRAEVRAGVVTTLENAVTAGTLPYVGTIFPARPTIATESAYVQTMQGQAIQESANGSACVVVVNILWDTRNRYANVGRAYVADWAKHRVELELFFASMAGDGVAAQEDYDAIYDALEKIIRANPTMSAPASVWSAGEYRYGVQHQQSTPYNPEESTAVLIDGVVRFEAWEDAIGLAGTV